MSTANRQQGRPQQRPQQQHQQQRGQQPRQQQQSQQPAGDQPQSQPGTALQVKEWEFVPFMQKEPIRLSISIIRQFIAVPTRQGFLPSDSDIVKFIMLCKAGALNPFERDAFLIGYDTKDGPQFNLITAHQAFLKRAEVHPEFDGMDSGVIVIDEDKQIAKREGVFTLDTDKVVGGWATIYFKKRGHPCHKTVKLGTYNTGRSRWEKDPAGMIVKVAEAAALRSSFPSTFGGMYLEGEFNDEEVQILEEKDQKSNGAGNQAVTTLDQLSRRLEHRPLNTAFPQGAQQPQPETVPARQQPRQESAPREREYVPESDAGYHGDDGSQETADDGATPAENEAYLRDRFSAVSLPEDVDAILHELKGPNAEADWSEWSDFIEELAQGALKRIYEARRDGAKPEWTEREAFLAKLRERNQASSVNSLREALISNHPQHKAEIDAACDARVAEIVDARTDQARSVQGGLLP